MAAPQSGTARADARRPLTVAVAVLAAGVAVSVGAGLVAAGEVRDDRAVEFERVARDARTAIDRRLESYTEALFGLRSLFAPGEPVSRASFRRALEVWDAFDRLPGLRAFSFNRRVARADLAAYEARVRAEGAAVGLADFRVSTDGDAPDLLVVEFLEPLEGNQAVLGVDIGAEPDRREAVEEARDSGAAVASPPLRLVQQGDGERARGVLITLPVYVSDEPPRTAPARRRAFTGVLVAVVDVETMLADALGDERLVELELYDVGPTVEPATPIGAGAPVAAGRWLALRPDDAPDPHAVVDLDASGRRWRHFATPGPAFVEGSERFLPVLVAAGGSVLAAAAALFVFVAGSAQARRARAAFDSYLDLTPDAVVVVDAGGAITHANANAEALFGYDRAELAGRPVHDLLPEPLRRGHADHVASYVASPEVRPMGLGLELRARRRDGTEFDVDVALAPVETDAGPGYAAAVRDASERREMERLIAHALEREREAGERLREADRMKDEFLDFTAHEMRTPLMSIAGFVDLLRRRSETLGEDRREALLERVAANADDMAEMVERLLDVSRLAAGRVEIELVPVPLLAEVDRAVAEVAHALKGRDVKVDVGADVVVEADVKGLGHVVRNLLSNAGKFTMPGGTVRVSGRVGQGRACLEVTDDGVGILPQEVPRLFDRFFQGSNRLPDSRGTGVGLSIVKRYVELMRGEITVASEPGRGSTFTVTLPVAAEGTMTGKGGPPA